MRKILLFSFIFIIGCSQNENLPQDLVAQVDDSHLLKQNVEYLLPANIERDSGLSLKKMLIKKWVEDEIIYQSALKEGMQFSEKEEYLIEEYKKSLMTQRYIDQKLNKNYKISEKEIEDYYDENKMEFVRQEDEIHLVHLLTKQYDRAIFNEINESDNLLTIIKKYYFDSQSTMESPNGDLGYISLNSLPAIIQNAQKSLKTGEISKPLKSEMGYHFIQVKDKQKKGSSIDLELVRDEIVRRLKWQKRQQDYKQLLNDLKENYQVQTYLSKVE